jgi:nitrate reductase gamma subunit
MIKVLKLRKAVYIIILGILALVAAQIMSENKVNGSSFVLGLSGVLLIIGAFMLLYPIFFAKQVDSEGDSVELKPVGKKIDEEPTTS